MVCTRKNAADASQKIEPSCRQDGVLSSSRRPEDTPRGTTARARERERRCAAAGRKTRPGQPGLVRESLAPIQFFFFLIYANSATWTSRAQHDGVMPIGGTPRPDPVILSNGQLARGRFREGPNDASLKPQAFSIVLEANISFASSPELRKKSFRKKD